MRLEPLGGLTQPNERRDVDALAVRKAEMHGRCSRHAAQTQQSSRRRSGHEPCRVLEAQSGESRLESFWSTDHSKHGVADMLQQSGFDEHRSMVLRHPRSVELAGADDVELPAEDDQG